MKRVVYIHMAQSINLNSHVCEKKYARNEIIDSDINCIGFQTAH